MQVSERIVLNQPAYMLFYLRKAPRASQTPLPGPTEGHNSGSSADTVLPERHAKSAQEKLQPAAASSTPKAQTPLPNGHISTAHSAPKRLQPDTEASSPRLNLLPASAPPGKRVKLTQPESQLTAHGTAASSKISSPEAAQAADPPASLQAEAEARGDAAGSHAPAGGEVKDGDPPHEHADTARRKTARSRLRYDSKLVHACRLRDSMGLHLWISDRLVTCASAEVLHCLRLL